MELPRIPRREAWREYLGLYRGSGGRIALSVLISIAPSYLLATAALLVRRVFDGALPQRDTRLFVTLVLTIVALQLLSHALLLFARWMVLDVTKGAVAVLRERLVDTMLGASRHHFDQASTAALHGVLVEDSERVDSMSNAVIIRLLPAIAGSVTLGVVLLSTSPRLFLVVLVVMPVALIASRVLRRKARQSTRHFHDAHRGFSVGVSSLLRLVDLTRTQTAEELEREASAARIQSLRTTSGRMSELQNAWIVVNQIALFLISAVVLLVGGFSIIGGELTLGELMSFLAATVLLRNQLAPATGVGQAVINGEEALERVYGLLRLVPPEPYHGTTRFGRNASSPAFAGGLAVEKVTFGYDPARPVLEDVSLRIGEGDVVALVGGNGAGKSTILRLILGLYAPQSGRILADGLAYDTLDVRHLRRSIGVVLQEPLILDATIRENLTYGADEVSDEALDEAMRLASAQEMIDEMPDGLDTRVGEGGQLLSGGQRQRIAVARALARRPGLLVLDEPTRHLDRPAVDALVRNLRGASWRHSTLLVSHDESVVAVADAVYVLRDHRLTPRPVLLKSEQHS